MLDYYQALNSLLYALPQPKVIQDYPLLEAVGLTLAEDVIVRLNVPQFDNSAMDGFALGGDLSGVQSWKIVNRISAGETIPRTKLKTGEAVRIFTGAPAPDGTSAIIPQEETKVEGDILYLLQSAEPGQNIRKQGEEFIRGEVLCNAHQMLTPAVIALLASQGYCSVRAFSPLRITVFSTGNELSDPDHSRNDGQIYDANRFLLLSWLKGTPFKIRDGGILPDNIDKIRERLSKAHTETDIIVTSGGVSVGEKDYLKQVIEQLGKLHFWKLAIKPGKPFAWGSIKHCTVFMLPGNPVSSLVTFQQLVIPALHVMMGQKAENCSVKPFYAKAGFYWQKKQERREFIRVTLENRNETLWAVPLPQQGSAMLSSCTGAHALAEIPPETTINKDDFVQIYPLNYRV